MSKCEYRRIPELLWFQEGPGVRNTQYTRTGVKLLNVANLVNGKVDLSTSDRYISEDEAYGKYKHFLVDNGDFIIASSGIKVEYFDKKMGFVSSSQLPLCMNTSTIRFKVIDKSILDIKYFMYYLKSEDFKRQLDVNITGSAQLNFGPSHIKRMTVPLVPLSEQLAIIERLDKTNDIIEKLNHQLTLLDELVKSRFVEMFGEPVYNPVEWDKLSLDEMCYSIVDCPHSTPKYTDEDTGYMCIRTSIVKKNEILWDRIEYISEEEYKQRIKRKKPQKGDIIYTREGAILGIAAIIDREYDVALGQRSMLLSPDTSKYKPEFICYAMNFDSFSNKVIQGTSGSASPHINVADIKGFKIISPPLKWQEQFADFVIQTDKSKLVVKKQIEKLETLKKSLMQEYFG